VWAVERTRSGRLSEQVLHEFYQVWTRKLATPLPRSAARAEVRQLSTWNPIPDGPELRERAFVVEDRFGLSWWDARIFAAAQQAHCGEILTEDLAAGADYDGVAIVNPFGEARARG
jgi:predicted nucleic acid-binding protein